MNLHPFALEQYFAKYEFTTKYLLSSSDCDGLVQKELLALADDETRSLWDHLTLGYTESLGHPMLREEIAKLYSGITSENVLCVVPEEGIFLALHAILTSGDNVICTFPGYQSLYEIAEGIGCKVTKWEPNEEQGWRFDPEFLEKNIQSNTKLLVINFPHNPTGYLPSLEEYTKIIEIAKKHNLFVFSDEMYRFLEYENKNRIPSACEIYDNAISLFGMSKTFGMAGVRVGWVVTKNAEIYQKMATHKDYTTICGNAPSEILSIIALRRKEYIIQNHLQRINRNLRILEAFFKKHEDRFSWVKPKAGTICFPRLVQGNAYDFCQKVVNETSIMVLPSTVYDYGDVHIRIGFGRENFPEILEKFEKYIMQKK